MRKCSWLTVPAGAVSLPKDRGVGQVDDERIHTQGTPAEKQVAQLPRAHTLATPLFSSPQVPKSFLLSRRHASTLLLVELYLQSDLQSATQKRGHYHPRCKEMAQRSTTSEGPELLRVQSQALPVLARPPSVSSPSLASLLAPPKKIPLDLLAEQDEEDDPECEEPETNTS